MRFLFFLLLTSCGFGPRFIEPELKEPIEVFFDDAGRHGKGPGHRSQIAVIKYAEFEKDSKMGDCTIYSNGRHEIRIRRGLDKKEELFVLYHELGHCAYLMPHIDTPHGIMSTYSHLYEDTHPSNWDRLRKEFWKNVPRWFDLIGPAIIEGDVCVSH